MAHEYEKTVAARHHAGLAHIATMPAPPAELKDWAALMTERFGPSIAVGAAGKADYSDERYGATDLSAYKKDWLHALLIVKWGEAPEHWPDTWNDDLIERSRSWAQGQTPKFIKYPAKKES